MTRVWLLLPILVVTGCGPPATFSRKTSAGCMTLKGVHVSTGGLGSVARAASAGAFRARVGTDAATVAFGRTAEEGKRIDAAYARALDAAGEPRKYLLFRNRNAVVVWAHMPGDDSRTAVEDCLVTS